MPRIGYFDPLTDLFVAVTDDDQAIVTHFPAEVEYAATLPDSDYA